VVALTRVNYQTRIDRVNHPPWGLLGGHSALGNQVGMRKKDGSLTLFPGGKVNMRLEAGESYVLHSGGGGGFGPPAKRERSAVLRDLQMGYISWQEADEVYGVQPTAQEITQHDLVGGPT
jgi:N-methylhydantoinase B